MAKLFTIKKWQHFGASDGKVCSRKRMTEVFSLKKLHRKILANKKGL
jgi:hypothetical protein